MTTRNNIILSINPSHSNPNEHLFWINVARHVRDKGWRLLEIATRALPHTENAVSVSLPAKLSDINRKLRNNSIPDNKEFEKWIPEREIHVLEDWEYRRWELDRRSSAVLQGLLRLIAFVDKTLEIINPAVILTTNRVDHSVCLYRKKALFEGIPAFLVERSPFDSILLEPKGIFAESVIWDHYRKEKGNHFSDEIIQLGIREIGGMIKNPHGFRPEGIKKNKKIHHLKELKKPIFFLPMDNVLWTTWEQLEHPINTIDNPLYKLPLEGILDVNEKVKKLNGVLVIKKHPADRYIKQSILPEDIIFMDGELTYFLKYADVVVTFLTKIAFNGVAMNKPVVTLGPNPIAASGATYHCTHRNQLFEVLKKALNRENFEEKIKAYPAFVGSLSSKLFFQIKDKHDKNQKGPIDFVDQLIDNAKQPVESIGNQSFLEMMSNIKKIADYNPARSQVRPPLLRKNPITQSLDIIKNDGIMIFQKKLLKRLKILKSKKISKTNHDYNYDWRNTAKNLKESGYKNLIDLWNRMDLKHYILTPGGCPDNEVEQLKGLKNKFYGEEIYMIDGKVSQNLLKELKNKITLGIDSLEENFKFLDWRPTLYIVTDWEYALNNEGKINSLDQMVRFFPQRFDGLLLLKENCYRFGEIFDENEKNIRRDEFCVNWGKYKSNIYRPSVRAAIQLTHYLGFKKKFVVSKEDVQEVRDD